MLKQFCFKQNTRSFILRQDGHELSYEISLIIHIDGRKVKVAFAMNIWYHEVANYSKIRRW